MTPVACQTALAIIGGLPDRPTEGERRRVLIRVVEMLDPALQGALLDVVAESLSAEETHGTLPARAHARLGIATEEVLEAAQELIGGALGLTRAINEHSWQRPDAVRVRAEIVQVCSVTLRMVVSHDQFTL